MFTQFDIIVSFITLLFATMGLFKGAIKSILGLGKWYGAGVFTLLLYPKVSEVVGQYMQPGMVANGIAVFLTYVTTLIILSILIGIFVAALGGTVGGAGDKLMGAVVGVTIGLIIASTAHYFIRSFGGGADPSWLKKGTTYEVTSKGADRLQDYFKDVVNKMGTDMGILKSVDPTGALANKIKEFERKTNLAVDYDKLKQAVQMMKEQGMSPEQIKDMIDIQDYMSLPQQVDGGTLEGVVDQAKKMQDNLPTPADNDNQ
jgi:uncharacterized membrane protein required for colicin V production